MRAFHIAQIPNPAYYEVETVSLEPISAVAIEIWTMNDGFLFDNVLLGHDLDAAKAFADATSGAKLAEEKAEEEKEKDVAEEAAGKGKSLLFERAHQLADLEFLAPVKPYLLVSRLLICGLRVRLEVELSR